MYRHITSQEPGTLTDWTPRLAPGTGLAHERLSAALAEDVTRGHLPVGARLPAHRELARELGLSVGTVTRAYATLQRRGLARSEHGRGMFVLAAPRRAPDRLDFSVNLPAAILTPRMLSDMLSAAAAALDPALFASYSPPAGTPQDRQFLAAHLAAARGLRVDPGHLLITTSAQHAIFIALATAPAGPVAVEALSYPQALTAARRLGRRLVPIALDAEGVCPDALEAALRAPDPPRALYLVPTLQNPTGAVMSAARRARIVALARRHDLILIEDDVYACLAPEAGPSLAELAPERVFHASSFSKSLAPGLRLGYLACPPTLVDPACDWLQSTTCMTSPHSCALMRHAVADGLLDSVATSIRAETARRHALAREVLGDAVFPTALPGLQVWLPMPVARARDIVRRAGQRNIQIASPLAFMADPAAPEAGLRLCLGNVTETELGPALEIIAGLVRDEAAARLDEGAVI
ncbi:aminotransferase class I/II-fold pyridoxal phosphate-dependent enzyme [Roseococcus thiosulfatophilus]|uniref:aminotransferase class I/II-fold pyridoxal phosphate-dependent enzyme n=1 Tax=Roseococcus thiosulfatophilus TaxID=35813 RepID=UPI001A8F6D30